MVINIKKVMAKAEQRRNAPKPMPKISVKETPFDRVLKSVPAAVKDKVNASVVRIDHKESILKDLWDQMSAVKKKRNILSSQTAALVVALEAKMRVDEGPTVADEFMAGNIPTGELRAHYGKIQALTEEAISLYDKIKYVEMYGKLPEDRVRLAPAGDSPDVSVLQIELIHLKDLIHKTKKKIALGKAKNPLRITEWHEKLSLAEARREDVRLKIKNLQYDARGQRADKAEA